MEWGSWLVTFPFCRIPVLLESCRSSQEERRGGGGGWVRTSYTLPLDLPLIFKRDICLVLFRDSLLPRPEKGPKPRREKRESCITCRRMLWMSQSYCIRCQTGYVNKGNLETPTKNLIWKLLCDSQCQERKHLNYASSWPNEAKKPWSQWCWKILPNKCNDWEKIAINRCKGWTSKYSIGFH